MSFLTRWTAATWELIVETAPWLLVGLVIAGLVQRYLNTRWIAARLGPDARHPVLLASLLGAPLPLCSCSVLPTAQALRQGGATRGATAAFLVATPETGPDSVGVTFGLFDPLFALFRPLAAWVSALVTGFLVDRTRGGGAEAPAAACDGDHCHDHGGEQEHGHAETTRGGWAATLRYAFVDLWQDLAPALTLGFVAGGLFGAALPADVLEKWVPAGLLGLIVVGLFGIPLSICATASTPLAAALVDRGLSPGAALVLLLTGPATNLATLALVRQMLGGRGLAAYLAGIFGTALAGGLLVDGWYRGRDGVLRGGLELAEHSHQAPWEWAAGGLLLVLFAVFWASRGWRSLEKRRVG